MNNKLEKISLKKKLKTKRNYYEVETLESITKDNRFVFQLNEKISELLLSYDREKEDIDKNIDILNSYPCDIFSNYKIIDLLKRKSYLDSILSFEKYEKESYQIILDSKLLDSGKNFMDSSFIISKRKELRKTLLNILHIQCHSETSKKNILEYKNDCCSEESLEIINHETMCGICGIIYKTRLETDGVSEENFSYQEKQDSIRITKPCYKRANHLIDKLNQKLVNTKLKVPEEVLEGIKKQMKIQKILDLRNLKIEDIRKILKKLGYEKYYEMEYTIFYKITGVKLLEFSENLINKIQTMFSKIMSSFDEINNKGRSSMFVYDYTIHKILELLSLDDYKKHFKPPKNIEKTTEYDKIWKKICEDLQWQYIPTSYL